MPNAASYRLEHTLDLTVEPKTVLQQVIEKLRQAIVEGVFKPGERLVEANLCNQLGVSRPSLREALRALEAEKLVVIMPNKGPSVAVLTWELAEQIYVVRALLEGEAAALAAKRASPEILDGMARALADFKTAAEAEDARGRVTSTAVFYGLLQKAGGNQIIAESLSNLMSRIDYLRSRSMANGARARDSLAEMQAILDAVAAGQPEQARQASMLHVQNAAIAAETVFRSGGKTS